MWIIWSRVRINVQIAGDNDSADECDLLVRAGGGGWEFGGALRCIQSAIVIGILEAAATIKWDRLSLDRFDPRALGSQVF